MKIKIIDLLKMFAGGKIPSKIFYIDEINKLKENKDV